MNGPVSLTPEDLALKRAFRAAVMAAGGQSFVASEIGRAQSRFSDWCSSNKADMPPVDVVRDVEALSAGHPNHPHVTRALARQAGGRFVIDSRSGSPDPARLSEWLAMVTREGADLVVALAGENLDSACADLSSNARARLAVEAEQQLAVLRRLLIAIDGCAREGGDVVPIGASERHSDTS